MYRHALTRTRTPEAAEELVHDVFCYLRDWVSRLEEEGDTPRSLKAMGWKVLRNRLIDENKRARNRHHHEIDSAGGDPVPGVTTACDGPTGVRYAIDLGHIYRAAQYQIERLPPKLRDPFVAVEVDKSMTQKQYAKAHGISQPTVSRRIAKAREILQSFLTLPAPPTHDTVSPLQRQYRSVE